MQELLVAMRQKQEIPDQLLLLEHPPVITLGRGGDTANLLAPAEELRRRGVRFYETTRGGDITYHGPGQLVGYPIVHLGEGSRDVRKYVTKLEEVLIRTSADFGIRATRVEGKHGIWVGSDKLAAIGVRIARWVTSHGFALNVDPDLGHFDLITPCGLQGSGVTSMARLTGRRPDMEDVRTAVARHFEEVFGSTTQNENESLQLVKVVVHDGAGRALLLHRRPARGDFWQPVTGTIEARESPAEAAGRELREETGYMAEPAAVDLCQSFIIESKFLEQTLKPPIVAHEWLFASELGSDMRIALDEEEHDGYGWFTFAEAYEKIRWSDDRDSIEAVEQMTRYPSPRVSGDRGQG